MPFFKNTEDFGVLSAPSFVHAPGYSLLASEKDTYTYPVDGWYWFDSLEEAYASFGLTATGYPVTAITKLAFRARFTQAEKVTIEIAQLDDPASSMPQRQLAAALRASQADLQVATYIDLARPDTIAGVQSLETYGMIAPGRAAVILSQTILPTERPVA